MNLKQGQEVRDAADPNRIGVVVLLALGDARVFWQDTERRTWVSEHPVTLAPRTAEDVLNNPEPGDRVEWEDGEVWTVTGRDTQILHDVTPPDGGGRTYGDRMGLDIWADPMEDGDFVCVPHSNAPPPTT